MADEDQINKGAASSRSSSGTQATPENMPRSLRKHRRKGEQFWEQARERLRTVKDDTDEYVRNNPAKAVFTALGIGFVLALMRRR
jgi:ElaB/YqjD/DUF883 family membrane-anchored ribosome-binding protein